MNETINLTLNTNPLFLAAVVAGVWTVLFGYVGIRVGGIGHKLSTGMRSLARDITTKDFSFKPEFDSRNGALKIAPYRYAEAFPPQMWL